MNSTFLFCKSSPFPPFTPMNLKMRLLHNQKSKAYFKTWTDESWSHFSLRYNENNERWEYTRGCSHCDLCNPEWSLWYCEYLFFCNSLTLNKFPDSFLLFLAKYLLPCSNKTWQISKCTKRNVYGHRRWSTKNKEQLFTNVTS